MAAVGGRILLMRNGIRYRAKGVFSYSLGGPERTIIMGHTGAEGYSEKPTAPYLEGELTDSREFDIKRDLYELKDETIVLELASGKSVVFRNAWYDGTGVVQTDEGNINFRMSAKEASEIR
ncbi:MAG: phage tail protein [Proteobacteria bacterium]|nr:MAG: phage tail protein [Pseudomonadota bacterium]